MQTDQVNSISRKSGSLGGRRPGAGRPKGAKDKATREAGATLAELARGHTELAITTLVDIAKGASSEAARVSAANALLDRGYGKPPQALEHSTPDASVIMFSTIYEVAPEDRKV